MSKKLMLVGLLVIAGCSSATRNARLPGSSGGFAGVQIDNAFDAAVKAVQGKYNIESIDRHNYLLRTAPSEYISRDGSGTLLPSKRTFRKIVILRLHPSSTGQTIVSVRVEIQRQDTSIAHAFAYQRQSSDIPTDTPINQASPGRSERSELWTFARRDQAEEQEILKAIKAIFNESTK